MGKFYILCIAALLAVACSSTPRGQSVNERKAEAYLLEGVDALQRRAYTEALRNLLEANRLDPKSPPIWTNLGVAYAGKNEVAKAEECWRKALQLDPKFNDARLNLGLLYLSKGHYTEAERVLKEASKDLAYVNADKVALQLANIYLVESKPLLAEEQLKNAIRGNAANCDAWMRLGLMQKERGDYVEAAQSMKGASSGVCYKNPQAHYEFASILLKTHDVQQAKLKLLEVIQLFPKSEWADRSEATLNMIR